MKPRYGKDELKRAYRNNLKKALIEVKKFANRLPGRLVITGDHGELLGENKIYGHPCNYEHSILREVPWFEIENQ